MAGSSVVQDIKERDGIIDIMLDWLADDTDGSVPDTDIKWPIGGILSHVTTNPGATAPTDLYDIVLEDRDGVDVMGGALGNRATATSEVAYPKEPAGAVNMNGVPVLGELTFKLTNNSVNSALGTVRLTVIKIG